MKKEKEENKNAKREKYDAGNVGECEGKEEIRNTRKRSKRRIRI